MKYFTILLSFVSLNSVALTTTSLGSTKIGSSPVKMTEAGCRGAGGHSGSANVATGNPSHPTASLSGCYMLDGSFSAY